MTITTSSSSSAISPSDRKTCPAVSICIPAYQAKRHLKATLDSALSQNSDDFEVVIVDNNSSDGTGRLLDGFKDPRVRVLRNNVTVSMIDNFNLAVRRSRGRYVKLVCADDLLTADCVRVQAAVLDSMPSVTLVSARTHFIDDDGEMLRPDRGLPGIVGRQSAEHVVRRIVCSGTNPIGPPVAAMFRRTDFDRCGGFRHVTSFLSELDLWVRLLGRGEFYGVPDTLAAFRIASDSTTALTSARSQLRQILGFAGTLADDPVWNITAGDRVRGRLRSYDMQFRRTGLYALSAMRSSRRRNTYRKALTPVVRA